MYPYINININWYRFYIEMNMTEKLILAFCEKRKTVNVLTFKKNLHYQLINDYRV